MLNVLASGPMAPLTADIPLCDLLGVDVVAHRMAAIASGPCRPLQVVGRVKRRPPVRPRANEILTPFVIRDLPLSRQREVVISNFCKISLLPKTAVNERDLAQSEFGDSVRSETGYQSFGMFSRITNDVGHRSFLPPVVNIGMALLA